MLSLNFKRMCSRVIASLSAMGVISIAGTSDADAVEDFIPKNPYGPTASFNYNRLSNLTLNAVYGQAKGACTATTNMGVQIAGSYTMISGTSEYKGKCTFYCNDGMFYNGSVTSFVVEGTAGTTIGNGTGACYFTKPTCASVGNATATVEGNATQGYTCRWKCGAGYHVNGKSQSTTEFALFGSGMTTPNQTLQAPNSCVANEYTVTFDCGTRGKISGTSNQTTTKTAKYGTAFTIDKSCTPVAGWSFNGWQGS